MYHSITFSDFFNPNDTVNTWDDWHLIPSTRPLVNPPQLNSKSIEIPGANGKTFLTSLLTGRPTYKNRTGQWDFYVENDHWPWEVTYSIIMAFLHGKVIKCVLEDDASYFYYGELTVNSWNSDRTHSRISINYDLYPFKQSMSSSLDDWLWDPFCFETDFVQDSLSDILVSGNKDVFVISDSPDRIVPSFIVNDISGTMTVRHGGAGSKTYSMPSNGSYSFSDIFLSNGENHFYFTGQGKVSIEYRRGVL